MFILLLSMKKNKNLSVSVNDLYGSNQFMQDKKLKKPALRQSYSKDAKLKQLQERNDKLQEQVIKVEKALVSLDEKPNYGIRLPEIKRDVIRKQIQNAYKQIKMYEYEIGKRKKLDFQGAYVEHLRKNEKILKEKETMSEKLRKQLLEAKKSSVEITKMLKDNNLKIEYQEKQSTLNKDIKWLHQKIKKIQLKKNQVNNNQQRQQQFVIKLQKQLTKQNYSKGFIQNLRIKIFNGAINNSIADEDEDDEVEAEIGADLLQFMDRSPDNYKIFMAEVKLYRKLQADYDLKIMLLTKEKQQSQEKNLVSRNKLLQIQYEIQQSQEKILELKKMQNPKALIPNNLSAIKEQLKRYTSVQKIAKNKVMIMHLFKFSQVGEATKAGKRFIDRNSIGKKMAKIVEIIFFQKKQDKHALIGLQATYLIGKTKKKGLLNLLADKNEVQQRHFQLQNQDYIKTIDCLRDENNVIVGVSMVSIKNIIIKAGIMTDRRQPIKMQPQEYPICLYGCILDSGLQMFGSQLGIVVQGIAD